MSKGNRIVVTAEPQGIWKRGIVSGTPKPGTFMQMVSGIAPNDNGQHTWEVYNTAGSGVPRVVAILEEDRGQGKLMTDAYVTGTECRVYLPVPGEELNVLITDITGTGATSDYVVGDLLEVIDALGTFRDVAVAGTGYLRSAPFQVLENYSDMVGDTHLHAMFTGY